MLSLNSDIQSDIIEAFYNTSRYMDETFNIDNPFFDTLFPFINRQEKANAGNVTQKIHPPLKQSTLIHTQTHTYPKELRLNKKTSQFFRRYF